MVWGQFLEKYVKNQYYNEKDVPEKSVDVEIAIKLKEENKAFRVENIHTVIQIAGELISQFYTIH